MSIEIPLLIREKIDHYIWLNLIKCVNLEYSESLFKYYDGTNQYVGHKSGIYIVLKNHWRWFTYRFSRNETTLNPLFADSYIYDIRGECVGDLPKHYHHIILKEIL